MSWDNPYKKRMKYSNDLNFNNNQKLVSNDKVEEKLDNNQSQVMIDINDIMNSSTENESIKVDIQNIPILFDNCKITGVPKLLVLSTQQLGVGILKYEKDFLNEEIKKMA